MLYLNLVLFQNFDKFRIFNLVEDQQLGCNKPNISSISSCCHYEMHAEEYLCKMWPELKFQEGGRSV